MTLDEALQELGIEASASPEEARRAYLRGIKTRKPETDPEGFRRLREAYETLTGALAEPPTVPVAPLDEEDEEDEAPPELKALAARLADLPAETRLEERLAALRDAVREHPRSLGTRWWLIEELGGAGRRDEVLAAIRQGEAEGLPGFLETRAVNFPETIGPEDLSRLEANGSPDVLAIVARVYMAGSRYGEAAATLGRALDGLARLENPGAAPVPGWLPRGILALEAAGKTAEARALYERLWGWLSGTGDADLLKRWGNDFFWRILHELGRLDPKFPAKLRQEAAQAALEGDLRKAVPAMDAFAKANSGRAEEASALLYDLPILYSCFFRPLQQINPEALKQPAASADSSDLRWIIWLVVMAVSALLRSLSCSDYPGSPKTSEPVVYNVQAMQAEAGAAWRAFRLSCEETPNPLPPALCDPAREVAHDIEETNCWAAKNSFSRLEAAVDATNSLDMAPVVEFESRVKHALGSGCSP